MRYPILTFLVLLIITACGGGGGGSSDSDPPTRERVVIAGAGNLGIFDPSVARDPGSNRLWMSYSSVETSAFYAPTDYWSVSIRLAFSDDQGKSWQDLGTVAGFNEELVGPLTESIPTADISAGSQGIWQSETSSLIYDPGAPVAERWKLVWFQYLNANLTSFFADYSWIAMKTASTPGDLITAPAVKLFGGFGLQPQNSLIGTPTFAPIGGIPQIQLNTDLMASLGSADRNEILSCVFTEPGLYASARAVYLALYCADLSAGLTQYIVYFRCNSPCTTTDAASWEYGGRLTSPSDAVAATGDDFYQAPALFEKAGDTYLIVTPVDNSVSTDRYNGCRTYRFTDVDSNLLQRSAGVLVNFASVDGDDGSHNGACEAMVGLDGGLWHSQTGARGTTEAFQIYKSQVKLP